MKKFCEMLQIAMVESNKTNKEVYSECGISRSSFSEYLSGKSEPKSDKILKLSEALNVNPAWLIGYDVPKHFHQLNDDGKNKVELYVDKMLLTYHK